MLVKLTRDARIAHKAGEIVEVSPAEAAFLLSVQSAEPVQDAPQEDTESKPKAKRTVKK